MTQFTPENNVLVGTIPDIKPIILPEGNPFTSRVMQFEKMRITAAEELHKTIDFWIQITETASTVFKVCNIESPMLNSAVPFLNDEALLTHVPKALKDILLNLQQKVLSEEVQTVVAQLSELSDEAVMDHSRALLGYTEEEVPKAFQLFLSMALKVVYVKSAALAELPKMEVEQSFHHCPMCGDAPIASVIDPMDNGLRYLVCNTCETKWHKVRSTCHSCPNTGKIELLSLEGQESAMKAESCPECHTYIKHLDRSKNPMLDVYVEDLATLALDFTLAEDEQQRKAFNLYLK